ncbi:MAG: PD-(D/E)XK nuclease family protein, partial [Planctomycetaceae bacterium]
LAFYPERAESSTSSLRSRLWSDKAMTEFKVPRPLSLEPLSEITVSGFKSYLTCPYRFYLRHVLRLKEFDDSSREMHPGQFGTIIHDVLDRFGRDTDIRDSLNAEDISQFLTSELDKVVRYRFGSVRTAATNVQVQRIRMRLERFSEWQARWASWGYRIRYAEDNNPDQKSDHIPLDLGDGTSVDLVGRIDRIDQKLDTNEWVIFDYKTSDSAKSPEETHLRGHKNLGKDRWADLQLPLYRHLAKALPTDSGQTYKVGYILLPGDLSKIRDSIARWSIDDLAEADELAQDVAKKIVSQKFWPPETSVEYPDFDRICQDNVFDREVLS